MVRLFRLSLPAALTTGDLAAGVTFWPAFLLAAAAGFFLACWCRMGYGVSVCTGWVLV
jgi:hypothetical protein